MRSRKGTSIRLVYNFQFSFQIYTMVYLLNKDTLPDSHSPDVHLSHPTREECIIISSNNAVSWKDSLTFSLYLKESEYLTTVPLAQDGGMTTWILTDKDLPPGHRRLLCSCETFRKRSLTSDVKGKVQEGIVHGIASVFTPPKYRHRGYAARLMNDLAKVLRSWQSEAIPCIGTILYSDIGKHYYANLGWLPDANVDYIFKPAKASWPLLAKSILNSDLATLCENDEAMVRHAMATPVNHIERRFTVIPDRDHMLWHITKEEFATRYLFEKVSPVKGAIAGPPGNRIWAIWTRRYYDHPNCELPNNVLYLLRLVVEGDKKLGKLPSGCDRTADASKHIEQVHSMNAILQAAQSEAYAWKLDQVVLWNPTPLVKGLIAQTGIEHSIVEREEECIASGM